MMVRKVALLAVLLAVASGCSGKKPQAAPQPLPVAVAQATRQQIATYLALDGQIAPHLQSTLSTPESGTITAVFANVGDRIRKGERLAQLDDAQLRAQLAANQASVGQSQAALASARIQAPISSQQYSSAVAAAEQNLQQARNAVATDEAALRNAELIYTSDSKLAAQGYVAQTALVQAHANYVAAQQALQDANQALPAAQAALETARTNTGQTKVNQSTIAAQRAALAQAEANVQLLQTQIAQSAIYAPYDGVVTARLLDPGAFAGPNAGILQVAQIDTVYVNANVPDEDLTYVRAGTPVTFVSASLPGRTFHGTFKAVNAVPTQGTLSYLAQIVQPNPDGTLRGGMLVTVTVTKQMHRDAIVVPRTALFQSDRGSGVYTIVEGKAKLLPVTVGIETDTLAEVTGNGVSPGMAVITTRPDALQDGSLVAVAGVPPASPAKAAR
ncbi:MAG: efflux RND transporter periplasmic adaptor subunit [Vulcanimicrobiaceae bacterium]